MKDARRGPRHHAGRRAPIPSLAVLVLLPALTLPATLLTACGSTTSPTTDSSAAAVKTTITTGIPKDASSEPPWNGRFVQVNVTIDKPGRMDAADWRVYVNGRQPELGKPATILPFSPHSATVAFVFQDPFTDLGTYSFRVVYAPVGRQQVERSWDYEW
jgi:hypothetical protein